MRAARPMSAWLHRHLQTLIGALGRLAQQPVSSVLTVLVIGIALALPASLYVLIANARAVSAHWVDALDLSVYLHTGVDTVEARELADRIGKRRDVDKVTLLTADQALQQFRQNSGFGAALDALPDNPLPHTLTVRPKSEFANGGHIENLAADLRRLPDIELVQLDTAWVNRFNALLDTVRRAVAVAGALLGIGVLAIVGNTIRLDIQNRRDEIEVTKLVGGSDAFVRRPFLYSGFWYGLGGGIIAWLTVCLLTVLLGGPTGRLAGLYGSNFILTGLGLVPSLYLLLAGVALGWTGSLIAANRHLSKIEPR
jgi:cell division transport system permease protein